MSERSYYNDNATCENVASMRDPFEIRLGSVRGQCVVRVGSLCNKLGIGMGASSQGTMGSGTIGNTKLRGETGNPDG